jgi:hypothetical protein
LLLLLTLPLLAFKILLSFSKDYSVPLSLELHNALPASSDTPPADTDAKMSHNSTSNGQFGSNQPPPHDFTNSKQFTDQLLSSSPTDNGQSELDQHMYYDPTGYEEPGSNQPLSHSGYEYLSSGNRDFPWATPNYPLETPYTPWHGLVSAGIPVQNAGNSLFVYGHDNGGNDGENDEENSDEDDEDDDEEDVEENTVQGPETTIRHEELTEPRWSQEEDSKLIELVITRKAWGVVCKRMPGRSRRSCCDRWYKDLARDSDRKVSRGKWMPYEDAAIVELRAKGKTYQEIADQLPGRTIEACRRHHHNKLGKQAEGMTFQVPSGSMV